MAQNRSIFRAFRTIVQQTIACTPFSILSGTEGLVGLLPADVNENDRQKQFPPQDCSVEYL
jgi:hypothetical protein